MKWARVVIDFFDFFRKLKGKAKNFCGETLEAVREAENKSMEGVYNLLDDGFLFDANIKLKLITTIYPKNYRAKYLLALVSILLNKRGNARSNLEKIPESGYEEDFVKRGKILSFIERGDFDAAREKYFDNLSIMLVERHIGEFEK
ncbi:MAG: hypothetical protein LBB09_03620 [Rickettsiales bacterium]|jgi:hypothetical protein|nr:hypothetical protein [Rickettsiales bacterium]